MEMAMLVMVVTFVLGTLMVTVALMQNSRITAMKNNFAERVALEQLGEDFCNKVKTDRSNISEFTSDEYNVDIDSEELVLVAREKDSRDIVMTIDLDETGTGGTKTYKVVKWEIK